MPASAPASSGAPSTSNPSWSYTGCFTDAVNPRTLPQWSNFNGPNMSNAACVSFCDSRGYTIAGTEYAGQCFCGDEITTPQLDEGSCNMACTGAAGEMCGGPGAFSLWTKSGSGSKKMAKRQQLNYRPWRKVMKY
ncbi:hypothetical protein AYL99_10504 [Fonsecaea erecta]|uniref:WSC domain-containing protein n=1 Tax=Fonsecaea erecta TaxID=1367422 RepID=A0A178Z7R9_9EURO|nr:hypothetical protein AYL99_10504 [Fonsecaea erecta]OAP55531.1 hypothetical protein AYL99_10504 [Fonsecaea erecta]